MVVARLQNLATRGRGLAEYAGWTNHIRALPPNDAMRKSSSDDMSFADPLANSILRLPSSIMQSSCLGPVPGRERVSDDASLSNTSPCMTSINSPIKSRNSVISQDITHKLCSNAANIRPIRTSSNQHPMRV